MTHQLSSYSKVLVMWLLFIPDHQQGKRGRVCPASHEQTGGAWEMGWLGVWV